MEKVLEFLNNALIWINSPVAKSILVFFGGQLWTRYPTTVNRAFPAVAMAGSILLGCGQLMAAMLVGLGGPQAVGFGGHGLSVALASAATGQKDLLAAVLAAVAGTVIPVVVASGTHSWWKNFLQWALDGYRVSKTG